MNNRRNDTHPTSTLEDTSSPKSQTSKSFLKLSQKQADFKPMVYDIKSESRPDKTYHVTNYRPNRFSCTCKDFLYRSHDKNGYATGHKCKHIKKILRELI